MVNTPFNQISSDNLQQLIDNGVAENRTIEYKLAQPSGKEADIKEFLADVSSFANSSGGDLIYGLQAVNGVPQKIVGLNVDFDKEISRLENILRDGLEPRIQILCKEVEKCLLIRVNKSWIGPHRIIYQKWDKFYGRNSNGKYPLDTMELRTAFNLTGALVDKIKHFRTERIMAISSGDFPLPFDEGAMIVLHLIPLTAFDPNSTVDVINLDSGKFQIIGSGSSGNRINLDGYLVFSSGENNKSYAYTQIYRNGIVEAVDATIINSAKKLIPSVFYEKELISATRSYLKNLQELKVSSPIAVFLTIVGAKGYRMAVSAGIGGKEYTIDKDILLLPEIYVENLSSNPAMILKPLFDMVWNACGFNRSYNYNEDGEWAPQR